MWKLIINTHLFSSSSFSCTRDKIDMQFHLNPVRKQTATDVKLKLWRTSEDAKVCLLTCCWPIHDLLSVMLQDLRKIYWAMQVGVAADRSFTSHWLPRHTEKVKNRTGVFSRSAPNLTPSLQTADNGSILQHKNKAITRHIRLWLHWGVMFMNITWGFSPK